MPFVAIAGLLLCALTLVSCRSGPKPVSPEPEPTPTPTETAQPSGDQPPAPPALTAPPQSVAASGKIQTTQVVYSANDRRLLALMVRHENPGTAPILVLLNDDFGIDDFLRARALRYAKMGYHVICPDLAELGADPTDDAVVLNIKGAMQGAEKELARDPVNRFAIIGWSTGGTHAFTAARYLDFEALIVCYGQLVTNPELLLGLREPVLGIFAMNDPLIKRTRIEAFKEIITKMGGRFEGNIWSDEGHGFMRLPVDPENVKEADIEIIHWLDTYFPR